MRILITIGLLSLLFSCQSKQSNQKLVSNPGQEKIDTLVMLTEKDTVKILSGDWKNTFNMYSRLDSIEINPKYSDPFIKMITINKQKVGIVIENSLLKLYHLRNGSFQQTSEDSLAGINWKTIKSDLNFDGNKDIVLSETEGAHGNSFTTALIFDLKSKTFIHKKCFDLPNLEIDSLKKIVRTKWYSAACGNSKKALYKSNKDSIELIESIRYFDSECGQNQKEKRFILFTEKTIKGKTIKDSILVNPNKAWEIFELSLWNTKDKW